MRLSVFLVGVGFLIPMFSLAAQPASIITRPGVATSPVKYYFNLASALEVGVNQSVKITVSASNAEKTAVRFDSINLFDQSGAIVGNNVASKTDALSTTPYTFVFQNFGVSADDLKKVAGVQLTFLDLGGENPTGRVTVQGVAVSLDRSVGDACVIADPITLVVTVKPPVTVEQQLVKPVTHHTGGSCLPTSSGPNSPGTMADDASIGSVIWGGPNNAKVSDNAYTSYLSAGSDISHYIQATNFSFSIPAGATIDGITVEAEKSKTGSGDITDISARLVKGGMPFSSDMYNTSVWPGVDAYSTYGSTSNLWGVTWTPDDINSSTFGFGLSAMGSGTPPITAQVDHIRITVNYTPTGCASVYDSFMNLIRTISKKISCRIAPSSVCVK